MGREIAFSGAAIAGGSRRLVAAAGHVRQDRRPLGSADAAIVEIKNLYKMLYDNFLLTITKALLEY